VCRQQARGHAASQQGFLDFLVCSHVLYGFVAKKYFSEYSRGGHAMERRIAARQLDRQAAVWLAASSESDFNLTTYMISTSSGSSNFFTYANKR